MPNYFPRCRVIPTSDYQVQFLVDGEERMRWHYGKQYPRPFLYPILGPSGSCLTRMGHPGAPDHEHHRSVWYAHMKVLGINFWGDNTGAHIDQKQWLAYQDGNEEAVMAALLGWYDGHNPEQLLEQEVVVALRPLDNFFKASGEYCIELQSTFTPQAESLEFGQTNFGYLAVRMAKNISARYGGGKLTGSSGATGEKGLFEKQSAWMDYSGPVPSGHVEGITCIDDPSNNEGAANPVHWHVRDDGWMGPSRCFGGPLTITKQKPLRLRYLLYVHEGDCDPSKVQAVANAFHRRAPFVVAAKKERGQQFTAYRDGA